MASIAYLFCWAFIAFLLVRDRKRRPTVSATTWIPTVMLFTLSSRTPGEWLGTAGNLIDQAFFASLIAISLFIASSRGLNWGKLVATNKALMFFYAYFFLSVMWSFSPADSLIRVIKDLGSTVIVVLIMLSEKDPVAAVRAVYFRVACMLIPLSAVLVRFSALGKTFNKDGLVDYSGAGQTKNELGELLLVCVLFVIWDHVEGRFAAGSEKWWRGIRWDTALLVIMGFWLLNLSQSKTSLVVLLIGLALILRRGFLDSQRISRIVFVIALLYPLLALTSQTVFAPLLAMLGRDATFTGRADIWRHITFGTVNPLLGAGFWNFWGGPGGKRIMDAMQTSIPNAHDGYLDIYLDGGLMGVSLLTGLLITCGRRVIKCLPGDRLSRMKFAFLIVAITHNVTESSFARPSGMWFSIVLSLISFPALRSQSRPAVEELRNPSRPDLHAEERAQEYAALQLQ